MAADLVIGADGRHSVVRARAGLPVEELGAPMDVLWFRLSKSPADAGATLGRFQRGLILVTLDRGDYWQCAYAIRKGGYESLRARGIEAFRGTVARFAPETRPHVHELRSFDDVSLLTVRVDRLRQWSRPGLLCIGDAAHAMSPLGGVGINLAIQDAVAAANILAEPLRERRLVPADLGRVQRRRELPTRIIQRMQVIVQNRAIAPALTGSGPLRVPLIVRLLGWIPWLQRIPARLVGVGIRPEHVRIAPRQ